MVKDTAIFIGQKEFRNVIFVFSAYGKLINVIKVTF